LRVSEFQAEYGLMGAGAVNNSLIARLPRQAQALGPVAAVSFRVASRIVNSLGAGIPARSAAELDGMRVILFHASPDQFPSLIDSLGTANIKWPGKSLVFCDCDSPISTGEVFRDRGASVAGLRKSPLATRLIVDGDGTALAFAWRMAKDLGMKAVELNPENVLAFEMALTLGSGALTPLIDQTALLLRQCGVRDADAARLSASLFEQTAREYARTGRQSWIWYQRAPDIGRLLAQLGSARKRFRKMAGELILFGLEETGRHTHSVRAIREILNREKEGD
jgi:hypothetical protein